MGAKEPYYTNSTQLPVFHTRDVFRALEHQDPLQTRYTGGTVFHIFLGERLTSIEATKSLVRKVAERFHLPYYSITPTFSVCPVHGYIAGEHFDCPVCRDARRVESQETALRRTHRQKGNWKTRGAAGLKTGPPLKNKKIHIFKRRKKWRKGKNCRQGSMN